MDKMKVLLYLGPSPFQKPKANLIQSLSQFYYLNGSFDKSFYLNLSFVNTNRTLDLIASCSPWTITLLLGILVVKKFPFSRGIFILNAFYQIIISLAILTLYKLKNLLLNGNYEIYIYSRSLMPSFFLAWLPFADHVFEIHGKENHKSLQKMQNKMISNDRIKRVYISNSLRSIYDDQASKRAIVLHDSSPFYMNRSLPLNINNIISNVKTKYKHMCVYSGSSGEGRGLKLICELAKDLPDVSFVMLSDAKIDSSPSNVIWLGFVNHRLALKIIKYADFALMPYQDDLQMGRYKINSLIWMSPLKLFDYMNSNVTIVSSYFPVLEEVLTDNVTCLFVSNYNDPQAWSKLLKASINSDSSKYQRIALEAKKLFENKYSYTHRTNSILKLFSI